MRIGLDEPRQLAPLLWALLGLFTLRVTCLAVMVARYPVQMYLHPESRWFGGTIPIFFHWVLAAFTIGVGLYHRRRLESR